MNARTPGPYPSDLLNEIHRLFPALLYDTGRFNNLAEIFNYIRGQMQQNFDLFTNARNDYLQLQGLNTPPRRTRVQQPATPPRVQRYTTRSVSTASTATAQPGETTNTYPLRNAMPLSEIPESQEFDDNSYLDGALTPIITNWLTSLLNPNMAANPSVVYTTTIPIPGWGGQAGNLFEPVIVRPSAAVLERATTVTVLAENTDSNCAVCQDSMNQGATVRKINVCGHTFHRTCIDTWFQTNVHCPTCRHDVRERARAQPATTPAPVVATRTSSNTDTS